MNIQQDPLSKDISVTELGKQAFSWYKNASCRTPDKQYTGVV